MLNIDQPQNKQKLLIFIHGLTGSTATWKYEDGTKTVYNYLQENPNITQNYDFGIFDYYSKIENLSSGFTQTIKAFLKRELGSRNSAQFNLPINEIAHLLETEIDERCQAYQEIVLIGHSMGGLVSKAYICQQLEKQKLLKITHFVSLAVPHRGSDLATYAKNVINSPQIKDLKPLENTINQLNDLWLAHATDLPPTKYFQGKFDTVVLPASAISYDVRTDIDISYVPHDHFSILTPPANDITLLSIANFLLMPSKKKAHSTNPLTVIQSDLAEIKQQLIGPAFDYALVPRHQKLTASIKSCNQDFEEISKKIEKISKTLTTTTDADTTGLLQESLRDSSLKQLKIDGERTNLKKEIVELEQNVTQYITYINSPEVADNPQLVQIRKLIAANQWEAATKAIDIAALDKRKTQYGQIDDLLANQKQNDAQQYRLHAQQILIDRPDGWFENTYKAYKNAVELNPDYDTVFSLAFFLQDHNQFSVAISFYEQALNLVANEYEKATILNNLGNLYSAKNEQTQAENTYLEALAIRRNLAKENPATYQSDVAMTLSNLGTLYSAKNEQKKAENAYVEALAIRRKLAKENPRTYGTYVAATLNNLGNLYRGKNEQKKAMNAFEKALAIRRNLAKENPWTYEPDVAATLNNLGALYSDKNEQKKAKNAYVEALAIRRKLAKENPWTYEPDVAATLNNLGALHSDKNEQDQAENAYVEALAIYRNLAKENPRTYGTYVATTLNNLGILYDDKNEQDQAANAYLEALAIRRKLAKENPRTYEPDVATTLNNLGILYSAKNEKKKAKNAYLETLAIRRKLVKENPRTYEPRLAITAINFSIFYTQLEPNKEKSLALAVESYRNALPYVEVLPIAQKCADMAIQIFEHWREDIEEYMANRAFL